MRGIYLDQSSAWSLFASTFTFSQTNCHHYLYLQTDKLSTWCPSYIISSIYGQFSLPAYDCLEIKTLKHSTLFSVVKFSNSDRTFTPPNIKSCIYSSEVNICFEYCSARGLATWGYFIRPFPKSI